jgi:hypothetical protein
MAEQKIKVMGDVTKDTALESAGPCPGNDANCGSDYSGASTPFVFTPINFSYNVKAKYTHSKNGSEDTYYLTPKKDMYAEFNLMQINSINRGAIGKDAAQELTDYYNGTLGSGGGPQMTKAFAEKVITEFHSELSKANWKTFFEKAIKNSLSTKNLLQSTFQDYVNHDFITNANRKAISYEGWGKTTCEKTYTVKVNVGVKPKFLKTCSLEDDKSRLKVVSPEKKFCKAFLAGIGEEKEVSDNNFLFEVTDKYDEQDPKSFSSGSTLGKLEAFNGDVFTPPNMAQSQQDLDKLQRDGAFSSYQSAVNNGGIVQFDSETRMLSAGTTVGGVRLQVEADASGGQATQDIYVMVTLDIGPAGEVALTKVAIGGRKASLGYALQRVAANMQGWMYQLWMSFTKPSDSRSEEAAQDAEDKAEEVAEKSEELTNETGETKTKVEGAAGVVAGATSGNTANALAAVADAKAAATAASNAAADTKTAQTALSTGEGSNPVTSNRNDANTAKVVTESSEVLGYLGNAENKLNQGNIAGAQTDMNQAVSKATAADNTAQEVKTVATEVHEVATAFNKEIIKVVRDQAGDGKDFSDQTKNVFTQIGKIVNESASGNKSSVKVVVDSNKENQADIELNLGGALVPGGSNNATIPKTSTDKTDLQPETRIESNDNTKGTGTFFFEKSAESETPNPTATFGANKGDGFTGDNDPSWVNPTLQGGVLEFKIIDKNAVSEEPAQNGKLSQ